LNGAKRIARSSVVKTEAEYGMKHRYRQPEGLAAMAFSVGDFLTADERRRSQTP
jgi:hypothetical protein